MAGHLFGSIDSRERLLDKRLELALHEWARFKANDSLECRKLPQHGKVAPDTRALSASEPNPMSLAAPRPPSNQITTLHNIRVARHGSAHGIATIDCSPDTGG
jgi:hypothetical protein